MTLVLLSYGLYSLPPSPVDAPADVTGKQAVAIAGCPAKSQLLWPPLAGEE